MKNCWGSFVNVRCKLDELTKNLKLRVLVYMKGSKFFLVLFFFPGGGGGGGGVGGEKRDF